MNNQNIESLDTESQAYIDTNEMYNKGEFNEQISNNDNTDERYQTNIGEKSVSLASSLSQLFNSNIVIQVTEPTLREETFTKYILYKIKGSDGHGNFQNIRRYSDFTSLRKIMVERWPGVYIPPLPDKKIMGNMEKNFIEHRRRHLEYFCKKISEIKYLYYSDEFQIFIRSSNPDIEKVLYSLSQIVYTDVISRFNAAFQNLNERDINNEMSLKLISFGDFLKKASTMFESLKKIAKETVQAKKKIYDNFDKFHYHLMIDYENMYLCEYQQDQDHRIFKGSNNAKLNNIIEEINYGGTEDTLEYILDTLRLEHKEINAMLEALSMKEKYEQFKIKAYEKKKNELQELQNIKMGKTSFLGRISFKSKEEQINQLEKNILQLNKDIESLNILCDMINFIIIQHEMLKFKTEKIARFYEIINKVSEDQAGSFKNVNMFYYF